MTNKLSLFPRLIIFIIIVFLGIFFKAFPLFTSKIWVFSVWLPVIWWTVGMLVGWIISESDRFVDILYVNPDTKLAEYTKRYLSEKKFLKAWQLLIYNRKLQIKLVFHSALFQIAWVFIAFFTLSSTTTFFGKGFIVGLGLSILLRQWQDWLKDKKFLQKWLWWQFVNKISIKNTYYYLLIMTFIVLIFWRWSL